MATYDELMAAAKKAKAQGNTAATKRLLELALAARGSAPKPKTGFFDQLSSGANEGIAMGAGTPVNIVTGALNAMMNRPDVFLPIGSDGAVGKPVVTEKSPAVPQSFGGSETMLSVMDPLISDAQPETMAQRYARRIGQEVGYGAVAAPAYAAAPAVRGAVAASPAAYYGASAAGDIGAGLAGQTATEVAPDSQAAQIAASILGGVAGSGLATSMIPKNMPAPTLDALKELAAKKWASVHSSDAALRPDATFALGAAMRDRIAKERATNPLLFPRANATVDELFPSGPAQPMKLGDVEDARRLIGRNVAASPDEAQVGVAMKREIDDYLKNLSPQSVAGSDPQQAVADLFAARGLTHRTKKAEEILNKEMRGESRAATSGVGGNEVNAVKQNIRTIFDRERDPTLKGKSKGYTKAEMDAMERVVFGTRASNAARRLGRFAPTSNSLSFLTTGIGGASGVTGAMMTSNPMYALPALVGGVGAVAKTAAERMTKKDIERLLNTILSGGVTTPNPARRAAGISIGGQLVGPMPQ